MRIANVGSHCERARQMGFLGVSLSPSYRLLFFIPIDRGGGWGIYNYDSSLENLTLSMRIFLFGLFL